MEAFLDFPENVRRDFVNLEIGRHHCTIPDRGNFSKFASTRGHKTIRELGEDMKRSAAPFGLAACFVVMARCISKSQWDKKAADVDVS